MEIEISYKAKDGRIFKDPYVCETYEKTLAEKQGTVGSLLQILECYTGWVCGTVVVRKDGFLQTKTFLTGKVGSSCTNLTEEKYGEQQQVECSVLRCMTHLREHFGREDLCQYIFNISDNKEMRGGTIVANNNPLMWSQSETDGK